MYDWKTIVEAVAFDSPLGEAFGPYAPLAFLALAATLFGVTLGVMVRGVLDQMRGPTGPERPVAVGYPLQTQEEATAEPVPAA